MPWQRKQLQVAGEETRASAPPIEPGSILATSETGFCKPKASAARSHHREANLPGCRQLIAELVNSEFEEMRAMFYRGPRAIEHAMSARREYMTKDGQIVYGGPDHYARLAATKHLRDFLAAGRPAPKQPEKQERRGMTLQELEELVASNEQSRSGVDVVA